MRLSIPSTHANPRFHCGFRRSAANFFVGIVSTLLLCSSAIARAQVFNITSGAIPLGSLNISTYANTSGVGFTAENIIGNFSLPAGAGPAALATNILTGNYPQGLTYMQTLTFSFDSGRQQRIFQRNDVGNVGTTLFGTIPDPPQNGYKLANGATSLAGDTTPWYSTITPTAGAAVPGNFFTGNQFQDTPQIPFAAIGVENGLTGLLNGLAGTWTFETALVGVNTIPANLSTGKYQVAVLKDFTWGFSWDGTGANTLIPLTSSDTVSDGFAKAFDRQGPNGAVEWDVAFTPEPGSVTLMFAAGGALLGFARLRRKGKRPVA